VTATCRRSIDTKVFLTFPTQENRKNEIVWFKSIQDEAILLAFIEEIVYLPVLMADISRLIEDTHVTFVAESLKAAHLMNELYGVPFKKFALTERSAIIDFMKWAIRENLGLPEDLKPA
jgi:hypothetical protein